MTSTFDRVTPALRDEILAHAELCAPAECCGLLVQFNGESWPRYVPATNVRTGLPDQFEIDPLTWCQCQDAGEILAVVHSHPNASARPSMADHVGCEASGLPWLIMSWPSGTLCETVPTGWQAPLEGREFAFALLDCYTLIQDWYSRSWGLVLPHFDREDGFWERKQLPDGSTRAPQPLYRQGLDAAGFDLVADGICPRLEDLQVGDVLLMRVASPEVENHGAIYLGNGYMLHHLYGQLSRRERLDFQWVRRVGAVARHRSADQALRAAVAA